MLRGHFVRYNYHRPAGIDRPTAYNVITTTNGRRRRHRVQRFFGGARTATVADTPSGPGGHAPRPIAAPGHSLPPSNPSPIDPGAVASARARPRTRGVDSRQSTRALEWVVSVCMCVCVFACKCVRRKCGSRPG